MKIIKTALKILLLLIVIAIAAVFFMVNSIKKGAIPKYSGEIISPGLGSDVTVYRDERGMPHIFASNEHDLYFSVGCVMAQERLWQMDLIRRATSGRLSEIFGESMVQTDLFLRSLAMEAKSRMVISNEEPAVIECLKAYTDGVNKYISAAGS